MPLLRLLVSLALLASLPARANDLHSALGPQPGGCPGSHIAPIALPHVRAAIARNHEVLIVAFGSSSTVSWMASDIGHSYPAVLQDELNDLLPGAHVAVINRGVGGQGAAQELSRLATDVLPIRPQLVIWQVGANDALADVDPAQFRREMLAGIARLQSAGIDVVLMDNQRAPRLIAAAEDNQIGRALADVAGDTGADLFARGALMDAWRAEGFPYASFVAADRLHHNDRGYRCVADALAQAIVQGLAGVQASKTPGHAIASPPRM